MKKHKQIDILTYNKIMGYLTDEIDCHLANKLVGKLTRKIWQFLNKNMNNIDVKILEYFEK